VTDRWLPPGTLVSSIKAYRHDITNIVGRRVKHHEPNLRQFSGFLPVPSTNKTDCHDITEILLNIINQTKPTKGLFPKIHEYIAIDCFSSNYLLETRQILDFEII
jgi:hypothetical protein